MTFSKDKWWDFLSFVYQPYLGKISNLTMFFLCFFGYLENRGFEAACWQGWQGSETRGQPEGMS